MRVILVRHAEAGPGQPDAQRTLTKTGRKAARALAARLADRHPSAVLSSPLLRARETATAIADAAGVALEVDARLEPGATADDVLAVVAGRGETIVVVGHQPDLSDVVLALAGEQVRFPTAGTHDIEL